MENRNQDEEEFLVALEQTRQIDKILSVKPIKRKCPTCRGKGVDPKANHRYTTGGHDDRSCPTCHGECEIEQGQIIVDHIELTQAQKRLIVEYHLHLSKGIFEDCEEFWEGLSQEEIDDLYPAYRAAAGRFMEELKQRILDGIG